MAIGNESNKSAEQNRKYCHQCRRKKIDFMAHCKKLKKDKPCTVPYCHPCLLNRYGENAKEVDKMEDWNCPKCQDICNCSNCMQNKGHWHTGSLTHAAKKSWFSSLHELLNHHIGSEILNSIDMTEVPNVAPYCPYKEGLTASKRSRNQCAEGEDNSKEAELHLNNENKNRRKKGSERGKWNPTAQREVSVAEGAKSKPHEELCRQEKLIEAPKVYCEEDIVLPQGSPLIEVASVKFPPEDVGSAFQFLEFCNTFAKVLDIKEGQPECILRDLFRGRIRCCGLSSPVVQFNIKLLSIEENINEENWVQTLGRCITKSQCLLDILPLDFFDDGLPGYDNLDQSEKPRILNFLCDEILWTVKPRKKMQSSTMK